MWTLEILTLSHEKPSVAFITSFSFYKNKTKQKQNPSYMWLSKILWINTITLMTRHQILATTIKRIVKMLNHNFTQKI